MTKKEMFRPLLVLLASLAATAAFALDPGIVAKLATGDGDERIAAINALVASGDERAPVLLNALAEGQLQVAGQRVLIVKDDKGIDAVTGAPIASLPEGREDVVVNNRLRRELEGAMAALKLVAPDRATRLAAAKGLAGGAGESILPLVKKAQAKETDADIKSILGYIAASMELKSPDKEIGRAHV